MPQKELKNICGEIIQKYNIEKNWDLREDLQAKLLEEVLPHIMASVSGSKMDTSLVEKIIYNYYYEAPKVKKFKSDSRFAKEILDYIQRVFCQHAPRYGISLNELGDFSQEVYLNILEKIENYNYRSKFTTWIYAIVLNSLREVAKSAKSAKDLLLDDDILENFPTKDENSNLFLWEILSKFKGEKDELKLKIIIMVYMGYTYKEIAEKLNLHPDNVNSIIARIRGGLRKLIESSRKPELSSLKNSCNMNLKLGK